MTPFEKAKARLADAEHQRQSGRSMFPDGCSSLEEAILFYEAQIILKALTLKGGRIVDAATILGMSYQGLRYILDTRQQGIAQMATPKRTRRRRAA